MFCDLTGRTHFYRNVVVLLSFSPAQLSISELCPPSLVIQDGAWEHLPALPQAVHLLMRKINYLKAFSRMGLWGINSHEVLLVLFVLLPAVVGSYLCSHCFAEMLLVGEILLWAPRNGAKQQKNTNKNALGDDSRWYQTLLSEVGIKSLPAFCCCTELSRTSCFSSISFLARWLIFKNEV